MNGESHSSLPVFFILGRPRSGTTLLRVLLDAHPNVVVPPEFPIIPILANKFMTIKQWDREKVLSFIDHIYENHTFGHRSIDQLRINRETLTREMLSLLPETTLGDLFTTFNANAESLFLNSHIDLVGDKNPLYTIYIKQIMKIFPGARFICLVRDYRDTFCSLREMNGTPIEAPNIALQVSHWKYYSTLFLRYHQELPDRFYLVRYEDLVSQPEHTFHKITQFLGISYHPSVFNFYLEKERIIETYSEENMLRFHKNLLYPINTSRVGVWKEKMSATEVVLADQIAGEIADRLGYKRKSNRFQLSICLKSLPMTIYGKLLFKCLEAGIWMPYSFRKFIAARLKDLVKLYMSFTKMVPGGKGITRSGNKTVPAHSLQSW